MTENYKEQLKDRPKEELEFLVDSHLSYPKEAVKAAIGLLEKKHGIERPLPFTQRHVRKYQKDELTWQNYFETFSYREVLSALTLAFLFNAFLIMLKYIRGISWVDEKFSLLLFFLAIAVCSFNHIIYKIEHKRRNLFMGRIMQNGLLMVFILIVMFLHNWLLGNGNFSSKLSSSLFLGIFFFLFGIEIIVSIMRRILTLFKWQIW